MKADKDSAKRDKLARVEIVHRARIVPEIARKFCLCTISQYQTFSR